MTRELYVAPLSCDALSRPTCGDYVVAVPDCRSDDIGRALVDTFANVVNTVVADVFIVSTELRPEALCAALRRLVDRRRLEVTVVYVEEMDWAAVSNRLHQPRAVA